MRHLQAVEVHDSPLFLFFIVNLSFGFTLTIARIRSVQLVDPNDHISLSVKRLEGEGDFHWAAIITIRFIVRSISNTF